MNLFIKFLVSIIVKNKKSLMTYSHEGQSRSAH